MAAVSTASTTITFAHQEVCVPLTDASLLDEYREAKKVWIAVRKDGQRGTGSSATDGNPVDPVYDSTNSTFSAGYHGRIWQVKRLVIENNIIELGIRSLSPITYGWASGIPMYGADLFKPAYSLQQMLIRRNIIHNLNDASAPATCAIEVAGAEKALFK